MNRPKLIPINPQRREFAKAALQGLLAGGADKTNNLRYIVQRSLSYAAVMIEELEKAEDDELEEHKKS